MSAEPAGSLVFPATMIAVFNKIFAKATNGDNDWIELYALEGSIDLSSYSIVNDNEEDIAQALPSVTLAKREFICL
jgi:hypothetical protein